MTLESVTLMRDSTMAAKMIQLLQDKTEQIFGFDVNRWFQWVWNRKPKLDPNTPNTNLCSVLLSIHVSRVL